MINQLAQDIHENAKAKGFYPEGSVRNMGEMLCLVHSEVSEAMEADRKDHFCQGDIKELLQLREQSEFLQAFEKQVKGSFEDELADIAIRVMDIAAYKGIDLQAHIEAKAHYNKTRPFKHGKNY